MSRFTGPVNMPLRLCRRKASRRHAAAARRGFTLVEILLVVVMVGVLAGVAVSMFGDVDDDAKDAVLIHNLQSIRLAFERFKVEHNGRLPGFTSLDDFGAHLTRYSNAAGAVSDTPSPSYPYGPYLPDRTLYNPVNNGVGIAESTDPINETPNNNLTDEDGAIVGWFLDSERCIVAPNAEGQTSSGVLRIKL